MSFDGTVYAVAFSPDGRTFLTAGRNKSGPALRCRHRAKYCRTFRHPSRCRMRRPLARTAILFFTGDDEGIARLWNIATEEHHRRANFRLQARGKGSIGEPWGGDRSSRKYGDEFTR